MTTLIEQKKAAMKEKAKGSSLDFDRVFWTYSKKIHSKGYFSKKDLICHSHDPFPHGSSEIIEKNLSTVNLSHDIDIAEITTDLSIAF